MAKKQTFADKLKKEKSGSLCAVCGGATQPVQPKSTLRITSRATTQASAEKTA